VGLPLVPEEGLSRNSGGSSLPFLFVGLILPGQLRRTWTALKLYQTQLPVTKMEAPARRAGILRLRGIRYWGYFLSRLGCAVQPGRIGIEAYLDVLDHPVPVEGTICGIPLT
jgi:hypothetical protein